MKIYRLSTSGYHSNCYVICTEDETGKKRGIVIDPTCQTSDIIDFARQNGICIEGIILTHGHFDHTVYLDELRDALNIPAYIHKDDNEMLGDSAKNAYSVFFNGAQTHKAADILLSGGEKIQLGQDELEIISTPGHSMGSVCILCGDILITGDTLFAHGYGRYDLYGASAPQLVASLNELSGLDRNLRIYPGHGNDALLGDALKNIYFI